MIYALYIALCPSVQMAILLLHCAYSQLSCDTDMYTLHTVCVMIMALYTALCPSVQMAIVLLHIHSCCAMRLRFYKLHCNTLLHVMIYAIIYCPVPFSANGYSITTLCIFTVVV